MSDVLPVTLFAMAVGLAVFVSLVLAFGIDSSASVRLTTCDDKGGPGVVTNESETHATVTCANGDRFSIVTRQLP